MATTKMMERTGMPMAGMPMTGTTGTMGAQRRRPRG